MIRKAVIITLMLFAASFALAYSADEQSFNIDPYGGLQKSSVRLAVNSKTSDVLVAWSQLVDPFQSQAQKKIFVVSCRMKEGGVFKVRKPVLIADDIFLHADIGISYNESDNSYLIVWGSSTGEDNSYALYSRRIGANGKDLGKISCLTNYNSSRTGVVITSVPQNSTIPRASYFISYYASRTFGSKHKRPGIYSAYLNSKGGFASSPVLVCSQRKAASDGSRPFKLLRLDDGGFVLNAGISGKSASYMPYLIKLNDKGEPLKKLRLMDKTSTYGSIMRLNENLLMISNNCYEDEYKDHQVVNRFYNFDLEPLSNGVESIAEFVNLGADGGAYGFSAKPGEGLKGYYIADSGDIGKEGRNIPCSAKPDGWYHLLETAALPGSNSVFIASVETSPRHPILRIRGFVFNAR